MTVTMVIPALNEEGNVGRLIDETFRVLPRDILSEMVVIDDGSSDRTGDEIKSLISIYPRLRYIRHSIRTGQSAAIRTGVLAARSPIIATMDGDGQNDPADIPKLLGRLGPGHTGPALVTGIVRGDTRKTHGASRAPWRIGCGKPSSKTAVTTRAVGSKSSGARHFFACPSLRACTGSARPCFSSTGRWSRLSLSTTVRALPGNPNTQISAGSSSDFTT